MTVDFLQKLFITELSNGWQDENYINKVIMLFES